MRVYYDSAYYEWQRESGEFGALVDLFKFQPHISPSDSLIEFGCGGGFLLSRIVCERKVGVEPNQAARRDAESKGLRVYKTVEDVPDRIATIVMSNHALEHVESPLEILRSLMPKMRGGAKIVFVVPHESELTPYDPNDVNQHLYTWTPQTLGNLFMAAGFTHIQVRSIRHMWPPFHRQFLAALGLPLFHLVCRTYAFLGGHYQLCVMAEKPAEKIQNSS